MPRKSWAGVAAGLLIALVVAGCGGGSLPPTDPTTAAPTTQAPTPDPTPTEPTPTEPTPTSDPPTPTESEEEDPVAYVPWGPADPVIPQHYGELARRDCDAAQASAPEDEFWDAVLAVCRSLAEGAPWPDLTEAPPLPETENPHEACLDAELATMIESAVTWYADHGDDAPEVVYSEAGSQCYLSVYSADQVPPDEDGTAPGPDQVTVAVVVDSTYDVTSVAVDGIDLPSGDYLDFGNDPFPGTRTVSVHVAAPPAPVQLTIEIALNEDGADRGTISTRVQVTPPEADPSPSVDGEDGGSESDGTSSSDDSEESNGDSEESNGDES